MGSDAAFHPELRIARFLPRSAVGARTLGPVRKLTNLIERTRPSGGTVETVDAHVSVRVFRPAQVRGPAPGLLFIHGGGYIIGTAAMGDSFCRRVANRLGVVAASVEYRLAPEHPFPTPLEDCYAALRWLTDQPDVDSERIALAGESAGGGLAAALALLARERAEVRPVLQVLSYPMLDDRTTERTDIDHRGLRLWSPRSNRFGWHSYLGPAASGAAPPLAAPARYENLSGVCPAWIGVGTNDLFHDENIAYAERLRRAGAPCTVHVVPGAYHGFDLIETWAPISRAFLQARLTALDDVLNGSDHAPG
ncbi:alpha/beta hydrolase [Nocardia vinacea]|uniref:Alpha/beta hydrolase n=1 Tax=Nocardia vinacea TaxID=96468 RepID=A0ABZ1YUE7_9NOCA|nr:alpha/beta hydrolase [Nocardia vinacea]